ncbi:endoplasmic reticulum metallopeptidase 1 [Anaeramoeba ignava]|uniref:Vacuolar membrane protease n=1 Tax=Anaeramoeba ignava TaxID=1746090 RepID=A0A9Q0LFZ5_ANAIG|nr:endoplasmic reticulum metallopeptidase 1 [Anaeramoeba ignava]
MHNSLTTKNNKETKEYILKKLNEIKEKNKDVHIEIEEQKGEGEIQRNERATDIYKNLENVVVRLFTSGSKKNNAVLVLAHFDSAIAGPGVADDGHAIATMIEMLSYFSANSKNLTKDLIFLFDNGEELGLLGADLFAAKHRWAKDVQFFINLEATGKIKGRPVLFRLNGNAYQKFHMMQVYSQHFAHPFTSSLIDDIQSFGLIRSDTDFTVLKNIALGFDFAFLDDTYIYHTWLDSLDNIQKGVLENFARDIISLIYGLEMMEDDPKMFLQKENINEQKDKKFQPIFFDFIGFFTVNIPFSYFVSIASFVLTIASLLLYKYSRAKRLMYNFMKLLLADLITIGGVLIITFLVEFLINRPFASYFSWQYALVYYGLLFMVLFVFVPQINQRSEVYALLTFIWAIALFFASLYRLGSSYLFLIWTITSLIGFAVSSVRVSYTTFDSRFPLLAFIIIVSSHLFSALITIIPFLKFFAYLVSRLPMQMGSHSDIIIAAFVCIIIILTFQALLFGFRRSYFAPLAIILLGLFLVLFFFSFFTLPYSSKAPKHVNIQHVIDIKDNTLSPEIEPNYSEMLVMTPNDGESRSLSTIALKHGFRWKKKFPNIHTSSLFGYNFFGAFFKEIPQEKSIFPTKFASDLNFKISCQKIDDSNEISIDLHSPNAFQVSIMSDSLIKSTDSDFVSYSYNFYSGLSSDFEISKKFLFVDQKENLDPLFLSIHYLDSSDDLNLIEDDLKEKIYFTRNTKTVIILKEIQCPSS